MHRALSRFLRDSRGNVAILFGLLAIPVIAMVGMGIDYGRGSSARHQLSAALDTAALALARNPDLTDEEARPYLENYMRDQLAALGYDGVWEIIDFEQEGATVNVSIAASLDTSLMGILNIDQMDIDVSTQVVREQKKVELALVLDNTGSMMGSKISALRDAAAALVEIMFEGEQSDEHVKISLVPFVTAVNIKSPGAFKMDWMDQLAEAEHHGEHFDPAIAPPCTGSGRNRVCPPIPSSGRTKWHGVVGDSGKVNHFKLFDQMRNVEWAGCVEARPGDLSMSDAPPDPSDPDTLFVPWLWPDDPDNGSYKDRARNYTNNYLPDGLDSSEQSNQRYVGKFFVVENGQVKDRTVSASLSGTYQETVRSPNKSCARPIVPLTNDVDKLEAEVAAMNAWHNSGTNIAEGLAWGWRVLSPDEPFAQGVPYDDSEVLKAMVLLTDGTNDWYGGQDTVNKSQYTPLGYLADKRLGTDNKNTAINKTNDRVKSLCASVKAKNIRLYTITFGVNNGTLQTIFRNCASETKLYFDNPSNEKLKSVFKEIAYDLSNLRISK